MSVSKRLRNQPWAHTLTVIPFSNSTTITNRLQHGGWRQEGEWRVRGWISLNVSWFHPLPCCVSDSWWNHGELVLRSQSRKRCDSVTVTLSLSFHSLARTQVNPCQRMYTRDQPKNRWHDVDHGHDRSEGYRVESWVRNLLDSLVTACHELEFDVGDMLAYRWWRWVTREWVLRHHLLLCESQCYTGTSKRNVHDGLTCHLVCERFSYPTSSWNTSSLWASFQLVYVFNKPLIERNDGSLLKVRSL